MYEKCRIFDRHNIVFLGQGDSQRAISMKPCALKTSEDTGQLKDKRKSATPRTDEQMNSI